MSWTARAVGLFREGEGRLPKDLDELFARKLPTGCSADHGAKDLFDHPLLFAPAADLKSFTVTSLGKDGKPGGSGANADVKAEGPETAKARER